MPYNRNRKSTDSILVGVKGYALDAAGGLLPLLPLVIVGAILAALITILWLLAGGDPATLHPAWLAISSLIVGVLLQYLTRYLWRVVPAKLVARGERLQADRERAAKVRQARLALAARGGYRDPERNAQEHE